MASPQKENGHIDIANEIAEALMRTNLTAYQSRIIWCIWRKTYGWHKKEDWISNSQMVEMTNIHKAHISRTIKELINRNIVTKGGNKISFQKDYTQWRELPKGVTMHHQLPKGVTDVTKGGLKVTSLGQKLPNEADTKETIQKKLTKETFTKEREYTPSQQMIEFINNPIKQEEVILYLSSKGLSIDLAKREITNFISYWSELNKSGTKQRWQLEKTFEIKRRLFTWFSRVKDFQKNNERKITNL